MAEKPDPIRVWVPEPQKPPVASGKAVAVYYGGPTKEQQRIQELERENARLREVIGWARRAIDGERFPLKGHVCDLLDAALKEPVPPEPGA